MIEDIRLHGTLSEQIEYFATIAGHDLSHRYFFEEEKGPHGDPFIRLFSQGNELVLTQQGVHHRGNGGLFCEYMFGGDQPLEDLTRKEVVNRLIMYGAVTSGEDDRIEFIPNVQGFLEYGKVFFEGNAVTNHLFFINFDEINDIQGQQETILRRIGKRLKRSPFVGRGDDLRLVHELLTEIGGPRAMFFLIRIVNKPHAAFYNLYREFYHRNKAISQNEDDRLQALGAHYGINQFDQERMRIDVIYKHPENRKIIDEYKDVLIEGEEKKEFTNNQRARLIRLRTLCVRNNIPIILPNILDDLLLKNRNVAAVSEPKHIQEAREIFGGLFIKEGNPDNLINNEDLIKLLWAKQRATEFQDPAFDGILMDTVRLCDELSEREGNDWPLENFGYIITHFDRYDASYVIINELAFNEDADLTPDKLKSLMGHKKAFDEISPALFRDLLIAPPLQNKYLTAYGRKKLQALTDGIRNVENGDQTLNDVAENITRIKAEEKHYLSVYARIRRTVRELYSRIQSKQERDVMRKQLFTELSLYLTIDKELLDHLLNQAILNINKEIYYSERMLPLILSGE
ncbi:MAG: TIGR04442 family protein, partial [bacterium]|nr:TIGR04442 family protein [bacterium]